MRGARANGRGFTMIEALLAIALILVLSGGVMTFLWQVWGQRDAMARLGGDSQAGSAVIERIEADLMAGLAGDASAGAGVVGTATTLKVLSRGVDLPGGTMAGDLQATEYDLSDAAIRARRWNAAGAAPAMETVSERLAAARLRYFDGEEWKESFDSKAQGLPVAVEVALWFGERWTEDGLPLRAPDRVRVVVVPDGPVAEWKESR